MTAAKSASSFNELVNPFAASTNPQTMQYNALRARMESQRDSDWAARHGDSVVRTLGAGLGLGMGGMALYHLARALKVPSRKEKRYADLTSGAPVPVKTASPNWGDVYQHVVRQIGSAPGAIANNVLAPLGLAKNVTATPDPELLRGALATTGIAGAGLLGLYGGGKMINKVMDMKNKADARDEVEEARKRYYAVLSGQDKAAAALDSVYEKMAFDPLASAYHAATDTAPRFALTTGLLSAALAAGVGGHYMYDRTAQRTRGENLAKAMASRARLKSLPAVYVDPEELARVKQIAEQKTDE